MPEAVTLPASIAITGASGLIGSHLSSRLAQAGCAVLPVRRSGTSGLQWRPDEGMHGEWAGAEAVVHLAGATIGKRWTPKRRRLILESRIPATRRFCDDLAALDEPPGMLVCASAVGYYGDRPEPVDETSGPGEGFLADVCEQWEAAADPARDAGIPVAHIRSGVVLSGRGGALVPLRRLAKAGLAGPIGGGRQWFSWIHIDDEVRAIEHIIAHRITGPVNLVSPGIVQQKDFAKALGKAFRRPAIAPMPGFMMQLMFGQMGKELFLWGQHAVPKKLEASGFRFEHPEVVGALQAARS